MAANNHRDTLPEWRAARMAKTISTRNTGAPKLERADGRDQNVKHKRSWTNNGGRDSKQRHRCDVTRRAA